MVIAPALSMQPIAPGATQTVTVPLYGKLSDLIGRRTLFIFAISVFLVGSALCGLAHSMLELILFRAIPRREQAWACASTRLCRPPSSP